MALTTAQKKLQIINLALLNQGEVQITQTELDNLSNPAAVAMSAYWDIVVEEVLGESDWPFATCTEVLSAVTSLTDCEWGYIYSYPTLPASTMWNIFNESTAADKYSQDFEVKYKPTTDTKYIFSMLDSAIAEYTYLVTDPLKWHPKFCIAMTYRLGAVTTMSISGDVEKSLKLMQLYNLILDEAKRILSSEKRKTPPESSAYLNARA